tara:strand:- start:477 stop:800 length:324 start_codon:yes stop_codon:yes gene_type:complete
MSKYTKLNKDRRFNHKGISTRTFKKINNNLYGKTKHTPFKKVDKRKLTEECPTGYMDFRNKSFGISGNYFEPIPSFCIEARARIPRTKDSSKHGPPPPGASLNQNTN